MKSQCVLEIPCGLIKDTSLHTIGEQFYLNLPEIKLHLQYVSFRPRLPAAATCHSSSAPSSATCPHTSPTTSSGYTPTHISTPNNLATPFADLPTSLLEEGIIVHKCHVPILIHWHVCGLVADTGATVTSRFVSCRAGCRTSTNGAAGAGVNGRLQVAYCAYSWLLASRRFRLLRQGK